LFLLNPAVHFAAIARIHERMQGGITSFFWDRGADNPMTYPQFLYTCDQASGHVAFAVLMANEIIGFVLLSDMLGKHRAHVSIWLEPKVRGVNSHLIAQCVLTSLHRDYQIENLYARTPWPHSQELCLRTGMIEVAEVPSYCKWGERVHDLKVFHSDASLWGKEKEEDYGSWRRRKYQRDERRSGA
jgi:hypothetical protein